jgi:hypothetical protein
MPLQVVYVTAVMMFIAIFPLPEIYDTFLRLVVFGTFAWGAYRNLSSGGKLSLLALVYACYAIMFNPIEPVNLTRYVWIALDLSGGVLLLVTKRHVAK